MNGLNRALVVKVIRLCICNSIVCIVFAYVLYKIMIRIINLEFLAFFITIVLYGVSYLLISFVSGTIDKGRLLNKIR